MTNKQKRFCDEYLIDCNATQAAIRAGYSAKTAVDIGHENLNTTQIYTHIENTELKIAAEANPLSKLDFSEKIQ